MSFHRCCLNCFHSASDSLGRLICGKSKKVAYATDVCPSFLAFPKLSML